MYLTTIKNLLLQTVYSLEFMPNVTAPNPREAKVITKSLSFEIDYDILGFMSEMWDKQQISVFAVIKVFRKNSSELANSFIFFSSISKFMLRETFRRPSSCFFFFQIMRFMGNYLSRLCECR